MNDYLAFYSLTLIVFLLIAYLGKRRTRAAWRNVIVGAIFLAHISLPILYCVKIIAKSFIGCQCL